MLDLYNREIIGYAAGEHKDAKLVRKALYSIKYDLRKISLFHTDYAEFGIVPTEDFNIQEKHSKTA